MKIGLLAALLAIAGASHADSGKTPMLIEMYTSKYCPNCPMAEHKFKGVADDNADVLVLFEHVDYWNRGTDRVDPYSLAEVTQRQYDASTSMGKRPGEVYTPMPVIDGQIMVSAPLMFTWGGAFERGRKLPEKPRLDVAKAADGDLLVKVPANLYGANRELWVLAVEPVEGSKVWRVRGVIPGDLGNKDKDGNVKVAAALLPKQPYSYVVVMHEVGTGPVVALGTLGVQK